MQYSPVFSSIPRRTLLNTSEHYIICSSPAGYGSTWDQLCGTTKAHQISKTRLLSLMSMRSNHFVNEWAFSWTTVAWVLLEDSWFDGSCGLLSKLTLTIWCDNQERTIQTTYSGNPFNNLRQGVLTVLFLNLFYKQADLCYVIFLPTYTSISLLIVYTADMWVAYKQNWIGVHGKWTTWVYSEIWFESHWSEVWALAQLHKSIKTQPQMGWDDSVSQCKKCVFIKWAGCYWYGYTPSLCLTEARCTFTVSV